MSDVVTWVALFGGFMVIGILHQIDMNRLSTAMTKELLHVGFDRSTDLDTMIRMTERINAMGAEIDALNQAAENAEIDRRMEAARAAEMPTDARGYL